jgi:hypothetical protein
LVGFRSGRLYDGALHHHAGGRILPQWGGDFRREYGRLNKSGKSFDSPPVLAFTASAAMEMQDRSSIVGHI